MGISRKSHGKKSDKETQSPVLKIFKDIMQKEIKDPEKVNLLKDKKREKKRKTHPESRLKSEPRSYDSSSTGGYRTKEHTKIIVQEQQDDRNGVFDHNKTKSEPFQGEKRESWWLWGDNNNQQKEKRKTSDDTCSCVSCALKKIVGSEYTCVACLFILFSISVAIIFLTVFKTMTLNDTAQVKSGDDDSLVNKMRALKEKRQLTEGYGWSDYTERNRWDDSSNLRKLPGALESDYIGDGIKNSNSPDMSNLSGDLANVLSSQKIIEGRKSDRLREFFKKLIQTDTQIRKLKQDISNNYLIDVKSITDRFKRSALKRHNKYNKDVDSKYKKFDKGLTNDLRAGNDKANCKRSLKANDTNVTRVMVQEEKIFIKYAPERRRNFPKCSHSHETKYHERKLKHPFYKNSQRIDEMINLYEKTTNKNVHENKIVEKTKKPNIEMINKTKDVNGKEKKLTDKNNIYDNIEDVFFDQHDTKAGNTNETVFNINNYLSATPAYDTSVALSISTFVSPVLETVQPQRKYTPVGRSGHRRLMQVDDEEDKEDLVYEDLKEVLEDEGQSQDDIDKQVERNKRDDTYYTEPSESPNKHSPQNTHNINWKGPMPLYPDELNAMLKHVSLQNMNRFPVNTKDVKQEKERPGKEVSDTEYIENYADIKYNKMLKMAQAYSDYGVLYNKKDRTDTVKNNDANKQDIKLKPYNNKESLLDRFFGRSKKGSCEGIAFQHKPGPGPNEREEFMNSLRKHIKIVKDPTKKIKYKKLNQMNLMFTRTDNAHDPPYITPDNEVHQSENIIFTPRKGLRSLKSIEITDNVNISNKVFNPLINDNNNDTNDNKTIFSTDGVLSFLSKLSDWLINLSDVSVDDNIEETKKNQSDGNQISIYNATRIIPNEISRDFNDTNTETDFNYPSYDSEMVDNIGHRSRVLMSIEDKNKANEMPMKNDVAQTTTETDSVVPLVLVLAKNDEQNITKDKERHEVEFKENKTIVKRNADERQSVFWNDLYDDEYGVKVDYLENIRKKHSAKKGKNAVKKSKDWFQNRFKNITRKIKGRFKKKSLTTTKKIVSTSNSRTPKRPVRQTNNNTDADIKKVFADLTENMKKVCQEAARAVQDTRNIEVREEKKEDSASSTLMQQLVRLMIDLVDIQVQQKNCAKLPSDLYKFLEWLTIPEDNNVDVSDLYPGPSYAIDDILNRFEKSTYPSYDITLTEDTHQEDRTECLGTIRAVQDLIQQYEGMSDEDKSKMTGVKEYLENQLEFLNRKLSGFAETNLFNLYDKEELPRIRRDLIRTSRENNKKQNVEGKMNKFIKIFERKRTKSTAKAYDGVTITKTKKYSNNPFRNKENININTNKDKVVDKNKYKDKTKLNNNN